QGGREVGGVLSGARADLEDRRAVGKHPAQDREDGIAIALAGIREALHCAGTRLRSWKVSSSRKRKVSRKLTEPSPCSSAAAGATKGAASTTRVIARCARSSWPLVRWTATASGAPASSTRISS